MHKKIEEMLTRYTERANDPELKLRALVEDRVANAMRKTFSILDVYCKNNLNATDADVRARAKDLLTVGYRFGKGPTLPTDTKAERDAIEKEWPDEVDYALQQLAQQPVGPAGNKTSVSQTASALSIRHRRASDQILDILATWYTFWYKFARKRR